MDKIRILGVDPGLAITGYGVISVSGMDFKLLEAGIIKNSPQQPLPKRLAAIHKGIAGLIREYGPCALVLEELFSHYKHQMTAIAMGHARGVIALTVGESANLKLVNYAAKRVKKAVTGNGNASKLQMQRTIQNVFNLKTLPQPADVSDAVGLALAHAYIMRKK